MNRKGFVGILLLLITTLAFGFVIFYYLQNSSSTSPTARLDQAREQAEGINQKTQQRAQEVAAVDNPAQILEYSDTTYQEALDSGKLVVLYFYANWCPICRNEFPKMQSAFSQLNGDKVVGIRVNYNDGDTTGEEEVIAEEFEIPYQHTKVFLKDGEVVLKDLESWDEEDYLSEISNHI